MIPGFAYGRAVRHAEKGSMKNATCYLHGLNLRPELCHDCARCERIVPAVRLHITDNERGAMERTIDLQGKIGFRLLRPIEAPAQSWHRDAWANVR